MINYLHNIFLHESFINSLIKFTLFHIYLYKITNTFLSIHITQIPLNLFENNSPVILFYFKDYKF